MPCEHVTLPNGLRAIVCGRPKVVALARCACGKKATLACDWKVPERQSGTCDAPICAGCALNVGPEKDLCKKHQASWACHPANPARTA